MNIQEHIKHRDDMFYIRGSSVLYISYINTEKSDLVEIDKQLYKLEREGALSSTVIDSAKGAVKAHHKNLTDIENQIRAYAGLTGEEAVIKLDRDIKKFYYSGAWELYKSDHQLVFDLIEKTDENFYGAFNDDEEYIGFITDYVEPYIEQSRASAHIYSNFLDESFTAGTGFNISYVGRLGQMYLRSLDMYNCALKNFQIDGGAKQKGLIESIGNWHEEQSQLSADWLMEAYKIDKGDNYIHAYSAVANIHKFKSAPESTKAKVEDFLREVWNDESLKAATDHRRAQKIPLKALIGLKEFGALNEEEEEAFNSAFDQGIIRDTGSNFYVDLP